MNIKKLIRCDTCRKFCDPEEMHSDDSGNYCFPCHEAWMRQEALAAGITESVIDGKTKLTDHFSQEYIDWKRGKKDDE